MNPLLDILAHGVQNNPANGITDAGAFAPAEPVAETPEGHEPTFAALMLGLTAAPRERLQTPRFGPEQVPVAMQSLQSLLPPTTLSTPNVEQIEQLLDQLTEESLLSMYQQLFGFESTQVEQADWRASAAKAGEGTVLLSEPAGDVASGMLPAANSAAPATILASVLAIAETGIEIGSDADNTAVENIKNIEPDSQLDNPHSRALALLFDSSKQSIAKPSDSGITDAQLKMTENEGAELASGKPPADVSRSELVVGVKAELLMLTQNDPRFAQRLVDHLHQLFPELKLESAEFVGTSEKIADHEPLLQTEGEPELLTEQAAKPFLRHVFNLEQRAIQSIKVQPLRDPEPRAEIKQPVVANSELATQTESSDSERVAVSQTKLSTGENAVGMAQQNSMSGTPHELLKTMTGNEKKSHLSEMQLGDVSTKGDSPVKLDEPLPLRSSTPTTGVEDFRIVMRRAHIDALLQRGEVKLQLQPEHLGTVKVELISEKSGMTARIEASSQEARHAIEHNLPQLRESFERLGLRLGQVDVTVTDDRLPRQHENSAHAQRGNIKRSNGIEQSEQLEVSPAASLRSAPLYVGGLNLLA